MTTMKTGEFCVVRIELSDYIYSVVQNISSIIITAVSARDIPQENKGLPDSSVQSTV